MMIRGTAPGRVRRVLLGSVMAATLLLGASACADKEKASEGTVAPGGDASSIAETQPVTVTGTDLAAVENFADDPAVGQDAPKLDGFDFAGNKVTYDFSDGPTMLVFLAHWCPHCNNEIPVLNNWKNSGQMPANLKILGVSTAVDPTREHYPPSEWIPNMQWTWPIMADSADQKAARAFGVSGYPFFAVIGTDGKVKVRNSGEVPIAQLIPMINAALNS